MQPFLVGVFGLLHLELCRDSVDVNNKEGILSMNDPIAIQR